LDSYRSNGVLPESTSGKKNLAHYKEATPSIQPNALKLQNLSVNKKPPYGGLLLE